MLRLVGSFFRWDSRLLTLPIDQCVRGRHQSMREATSMHAEMSRSIYSQIRSEGSRPNSPTVPTKKARTSNLPAPGTEGYESLPPVSSRYASLFRFVMLHFNLGLEPARVSQRRQRNSALVQSTFSSTCSFFSHCLHQLSHHQNSVRTTIPNQEDKPTVSHINAPFVTFIHTYHSVVTRRGILPQLSWLKKRKH